MKTQFRFRKKERLCSRKLISQLFQNGKSISFGSLRLLFQFTNEEINVPAQVLISVSKKSFKSAVKRNRMKRRIREAYRLNKSELTSLLNEKNQRILLAFLYNEKELQSFQEVQTTMQQILKQVLGRIQKSAKS